MVSKTNGGAYSGSVDFTGGLEINGTAVTATAAELNTLDGITASTAELNTLDGVTATTSEINTLDGITASTAELNLLDGVTATTAELNYVDGVTSNIQTQIDNISTDVVSDTSPSLGGDLDTNGNDVNFGDNDKAQFGAGNDLQIYHNGSASVIKDAGTGNFFISGDNDVFISKSDLSEVKAKFSSDGAVSLYHDNSKKLETASHGATVYGGLVSDGSATTTSFNSNGTNTAANSYNYILGASNNSGHRAAMFVNGTTRTADGGANALTFRNDGGKLILGSSGHPTEIIGTSVTLPTLFNVVRKDVTLVSNITTSTDGYVYGNYGIGSHTSSNTKAVILAVQFQYNAGGNKHGYMNGYLVQQGKTSGTARGNFIREHFDWYYNRYDTELIIPWDASGTQSVQLYISSSHNTSSSNRYSIILRGVINQ